MAVEKTNLKCPTCGADLIPNAKFCTSCGSDVTQAKSENQCPSCGAELLPNAKFCDKCGSDVTSSTETEEPETEETPAKTETTEEEVAEEKPETEETPAETETKEPDTIDAMYAAKCPSCGAELIPNAKFCDKCGADIESAPKTTTTETKEETSTTCPSCGAELLPNAKFCDKCGSSITNAPKTTGTATTVVTDSLKDNEVRIGGIRFNIPDGYKENVSLREVNEYDASAGTNSFCQVYSKDDTTVSIRVGTYKKGIVDDDFVRRYAKDQNWEKTEIAGIESYLGKLTHKGLTMDTLCYNQLNRFVVITSTDGEKAKEFVVKNNDSDYKMLPTPQYKGSPNTGKLIYGIIGLVITLFLMYGASTGSLVLRGTNSSSALFLVCILFLIGDLYYIYKAYKG